MSTSGTTNITCQLGCWGIAALAGLLSAAALWVLGGWSFMQGAFVGAVVFVVLGIFLSWTLCRPLPGPNALKSPVGSNDTAARTAGRAAGSGASASTGASDAGTSVVSEAEPVTATEPSQPSEDAAPASSAAASGVASASSTPEAVIKPSTPLPGQDELAGRKGTWRYDGGDAQPTPAADAKADTIADYDGDGVLEGSEEGTKPQALDAPRDGGADDLKRIKGIGPKLEKLCNSLGFYHFDQIAAWTADEVAWVDANLEGFRGRVSRDEWVKQAKLLSSGEETEFSKRVDEGDVY